MNDHQDRCPSLLLECALKSITDSPHVKAGDRVLAAMSGGIDSSVMAVILKLAKLDVVGVSMQLFDKTHDSYNGESSCCTLDDFNDARRVAFKFGFPHYVINFEKKFQETVISSFVDDYIFGKTPSPCIRCNQHIKFGTLLDTATELNCNFIATGHYARIVKDSSGYHLLKASDANKDQSYFLFTHNQKSLARTLFPLAEFSKTEVRQLARHLGIHVAEKSESQEICFISGHYYDYINQSRQLSTKIGDIRHINGKTLGSHLGYWRFTVGQRKGIGVSYPTPLFVVQVDPATNIVWVGDNENLFDTELIATEVSWCLEPLSDSCFSCRVKIRSRSQEMDANIYMIEDGKVKIVFNTPQRAIAPGQAVVFYSENEILGGGWIETNIRKYPIDSKNYYH